MTRSEVRDLFATMELHTVPDALSFPSLRAIHLKVGDVLFIPGGSLICEKAINDVSLALKVYCPFMDSVSSKAYRIAMKQVLSLGLGEMEGCCRGVYFQCLHFCKLVFLLGHLRPRR